MRNIAKSLELVFYNGQSSVVGGTTTGVIAYVAQVRQGRAVARRWACYHHE
jgi:hypothetical protein